jgi:hypothetical protein
MPFTTLERIDARGLTVNFFQSSDRPVPNSEIGGAEGIIMALPPF